MITSCQVKDASHKRARDVRFHEMVTISKTTEIKEYLLIRAEAGGCGGWEKRLMAAQH